MGNEWTIRGREIDDSDVILIRDVIKKFFHKGRKYISRQICHEWKWYQPNGQPKDMACRYILLFLEKEGFVKLPPRLISANNEKKKTKTIKLDEIPLAGTVKDYPPFSMQLLTKQKEYSLWNSIIDSYHYQGHRLIVGKFLKYIVYLNNIPVACLGWGSAAWSVASRDNWIGWNKEIKDKNLAGIVNNIRFLILPWVKIKYLASHLLGLSIKQVPLDWSRRYGDTIYLLETFVEKNRFKGTCYKAANWIYLGETKGNAKRGSSHTYHGNIKDIYVYPLYQDFRKKLLGI